jgi:ABC-type uncharacterized transport system substrate-binding protein
MLRLSGLILGLCLLLPGAVLAQAATVVVVSSERSAAYLEAAEALTEQLEKGGLARQQVQVIPVSEWSGVSALKPSLFVALGAQAAELLVRADLTAPLLCTLLPRASFERALAAVGRKSGKPVSAVFLDQPVSRQLNLIRLAMPAAHRLGVLWGLESMGRAPVFRSLAQSRQLELVEATVGPDEALFPALQRVLHQSDLLLAVPDAAVYNSSNIQNILLASVRAKVPLLAFSPAYARAGAALALYVTPTQLGAQAGRLAHSVLQGKELPATPLYAQDFELLVNQPVARALGLKLDAAALREQLRRDEVAP